MTPPDQSPAKPHFYYVGNRSELLDWVGGRHQAVLDIGCGEGGNAAWFRDHGTQRIVGVEIDKTSHQLAQHRYDLVLNESIEQAVDRLDERFDLVVCADVLEHLINPGQVLDQLRPLTANGGCLAASIPNIRYYRALARIALGAGFTYEDEGIFDRTHLRFFTRSGIAQMFQEAGWRVARWGGKRGRAARLLGPATGGLAYEWLTFQWWVVAHPADWRPTTRR